MMKSSRERGSVTPLVAILVAGGVLLGMMTFAVDAGQIMWERRQTQNAADASALALAQSCAKGNCVAGADNLAGLVAANTNNVAPGRDHVIERQCGRNVTSGTLPACTNAPSLTELRECPPLPAGISPLLPQVEVRVRAEQGGQPWIPNPFARASGGTETTNVTSCARGVGHPRDHDLHVPDHDLDVRVAEVLHRWALVCRSRAGRPVAGLRGRRPTGIPPGRDPAQHRRSRDHHQTS
jgi:hypothetical protein